MSLGLGIRNAFRTGTKGDLVDRFKAEDWEKLTPEEKVRRCRMMADQAKALANNASPALAKTYMAIAEDWLKLAVDLAQGPDFPKS
jgi:hypothetical protein